MNKNFRIGAITIIVAFMLSIMPLPTWLMQYRPEWIAMALIYWTINQPSHIGVFTAWLLGLLLDVSYGTLLGQHAIGMMLVVYVIQIQHLRLRAASLFQQAVVIFVLLLIKQLIVLWVDGMLGRAPNTWLYFLPTITSCILWPWYYLIMRDLHRKFGKISAYT